MASVEVLSHSLEIGMIGGPVSAEFTHDFAIVREKGAWHLPNARFDPVRPVSAEERSQTGPPDGGTHDGTSRSQLRTEGLIEFTLGI